MLKQLKNFKTAPRPLLRVLHFQSPLKNSKSIQSQKIGSKTYSKSHAEPRLSVPSVTEPKNYKFEEGKIYQGFQCERIESIPDFGLTSCTFRHVRAGTEFWYLDRNDIHNVFSINFRTTPFNSTGLPHILEHLTLCGSKNYPVRDPFFKMLNRSVATFMNAITGPDYTMYPFSSMNEVDFRNLQKIYLDAVFSPNLLTLDFLQEGWRLEYNDVHNRESHLAIKGVVYTEMIGAFSDIDMLFKQKMLNHILPSNTYGNIAGGNPLDIPKVTHKDLIEFHRKYYHPSNARIFCYGSFDLEKTLAFIDKEYLSHHVFIDNSYSSIPPQKRWTEPRSAHVTGRLDSMGASLEKQSKIAIGLLMCDITDIQQCFELSVLSELMIRGPNSAFNKTLIQGNFSGGYCKGTGFLPDCKDTYFVVGLRDVRIEDFDRFNELFDEAVQRATVEGFEPLHIDSVLCNLELSLKHESEYFGKRLLYKSAVLWNHGGDVVSGLQVSKLMSTLRRKLKEDPKYFQKIVEKYFINNPHKLTLTMSPDENYDVKFKLAEAKLLVEKLNEITDKEFDQIYENGIILEETQKANQNLGVLPCLSIGDVKDPVKRPLLEEKTLENVPIQLCKVASNGITYLKCIFNITGLSHDDVLLVPLFCYVFRKMGTSKHDFLQFDKLVRSKIASITCNVKLVENLLDGKSYRLGLLMSTHALDKNVPDMFQICEELMLNFKVEDTERLKILIEKYISKCLNDIGNSGHLFAMIVSSGLVTNAAQLRSQLSGIEHIDFMKKYVKITSIEEIRDRLAKLGSKIFGKNNLRVAINSLDAYQATAVEHCDRFLKNLPTLEKTVDSTELHLLEPSSRHFVLNKPLSYCAKSFSAVPYTHEDHPVLRILAKFVAAKYLLPFVREQIGAYGAGARIGFDGVFSFHSYRDPHAPKTIEVFDKTYEWLQAESAKLDQQALFEAKLGALQLVDWPNGPGDINMDNFVLGASYDIYSRYRYRVLSVTIDEVRAVIEKYLKNGPKHFGKCILGPEIEMKKEEINNRVQM